MNPFKKFTTAIAAALLLASGGTAQAIMTGVAGEALLVPFVFHDGNPNTFVGITVPKAVGQ